MTYKEFLNIVTFEEVAPHIVNMYPEEKTASDGLSYIMICSNR